MTVLFTLLWPEILLVVVGSALLLLGVVNAPGARRIAPVAAFASFVTIFAVLLWSGLDTDVTSDPWQTIQIFTFQQYVKLIAAGAGILLTLLAWPTNPDATGNPALQFGHEAGEFFGLMLLSVAGIFFVASANDIILLFLGIELASFPTYIMVSISRPLPVAQEAGVKYFFLGAMAAAIMLFGFSYLYGTTGATRLGDIQSAMALHQPGHDWQIMAIVMLLAGLAFKIAAVPLHSYAGDVYQGAATPVTAFLAFVPKTSGFIAILKILFYSSGSGPGTHPWLMPDTISKLLWVLAVLTMFVGNVMALGFLQYNVKRVLAYSSVAHSGYMLVGVTALVTSSNPQVQAAALGGVLFYLAAYGIMNTGAFGVLMMIPSRDTHFAGYLEPSTDTTQVPAETGTSAETFDDLAGQGRRHPALGMAMAVCCLSLTGLPFTVGFFGKVFLIKPAWQVANEQPEVKTRMTWLVVLTVLNAAISAGYYLRIIAAMYLRPEPPPLGTPAAGFGGPPESRSVAVESATPLARPWPILAGIALSVLGTLVFGIYFPATDKLANEAQTARLESPIYAVPGPGARPSAPSVTLLPAR
jgi:NADH-quinone oxidoreductase subunit N